MSFAGLAPEIINGRGAMIGMLAAFGAEVRTHTGVLQQVRSALYALVSCPHVIGHGPSGVGVMLL